MERAFPSAGKSNSVRRGERKGGKETEERKEIAVQKSELLREIPRYFR